MKIFYYPFYTIILNTFKKYVNGLKSQTRTQQPTKAQTSNPHIKTISNTFLLPITLAASLLSLSLRFFFFTSQTTKTLFSLHTSKNTRADARVQL
jgi:hypothetical protein